MTFTSSSVFGFFFYPFAFLPAFSRPSPFFLLYTIFPPLHFLPYPLAFLLPPRDPEPASKSKNAKPQDREPNITSEPIPHTPLLGLLGPPLGLLLQPPDVLAPLVRRAVGLNAGLALGGELGLPVGLALLLLGKRVLLVVLDCGCYRVRVVVGFGWGGGFA